MKRPRSPEAAPERVPTATGPSPRTQAANQTAEEVEEVVLVEETSDVLVRFPCFDFFRSVHLCERRGEASAVTFAPDTVHFVPESLGTDHPVLVINPCTDKEMIFGCTWAEVCASSGVTGTNRAIVHMSESDAPETQHDESLPSLTGRSDGVVASLLGHVAGGVSADEKRVQRLDHIARAHQQTYDLVTAPAAVLVAERLR